MILQQQLGDAQQSLADEAFFSARRTPATDLGLLGNQLAQSPSLEGVAASLVDIYYRIRNTSEPAFKLALIKQQKFTPEGKDSRVAASLAALNAAQPTKLSLAEWQQVLEEAEDVEV
ncbi:MAG TPA: hypothetical protein VGR55_12240 [Candidatus Acidoferrum sp.]|nr:hypothetical protein [Candidatus Acidoferrum sp.]